MLLPYYTSYSTLWCTIWSANISWVEQLIFVPSFLETVSFKVLKYNVTYKMFFTSFKIKQYWKLSKRSNFIRVIASHLKLFHGKALFLLILLKKGFSNFSNKSYVYPDIFWPTRWAWKQIYLIYNKIIRWNILTIFA